LFGLDGAGPDGGVGTAVAAAAPRVSSSLDAATIGAGGVASYAEEGGERASV